MLKEMISRFNSKTPLFFRKVQGICATVSAVSLSSIALGDNLPEGAVPLLKYGVACGIVGVVIGQLTKTDKSDCHEEKTVEPTEDLKV